MHELSLISNLLDIVQEKADEINAVKITRIRLQVGVLSGAVPELLESAFDIYKKETIAADAFLEIVRIPLKVRCRACGCESEGDDIILKCTECDSADLETIAGTDMIIEKIELET